jgi:site-specific DNA recombinase
VKKSEIPFLPGDEVVAYLRDSGHENQELSVDQQESELREFCIEHGIVLFRTYIDEARQGSSDKKRDKLAEMMHDLRRHLPVAGVIVWSNSRFARQSLHAQFYRAEIRKLGYIFYSLTGKSVEGPEAIIFEALDDYKNERFLSDLSIDVKRGLKRLVLDYGCVPGRPPKGFKQELVVIGEHRDGKTRSAHKWVPDELVAPRVVEAFEMRMNGVSLAIINDKTHLFTTINGFRTFFSNPIYKGTLQFGDEVVENYCEPMVDPLIWEAVQNVQNNYAHRRNLAGGGRLHPRRVSSQYLLSGLIHCARCDSSLFGRTHPQRNGSKTTSYYCSQAYNQRNCSKHRIPGALIEELVLTKLKETWLKPEFLAAAQSELQAKSAKIQTETKARRAQATAELAELRRQLTNLSIAVGESGHSRALLKRLSDLEHQESEKQNQIAQLDEKLRAVIIPTVEPGRAEKLIRMLDVVFPKADIRTRRMILNGLIERIDVDRDGRRIFGTITVKYPPSDDDDLVNGSPPSGKTGRGRKTVRMKSRASGPQRVTFCARKSPVFDEQNSSETGLFRFRL